MSDGSATRNRFRIFLPVATALFLGLTTRIAVAATTFQAAAIEPASGLSSGGSDAVLSGNRFQAGATVKIGGISATNVSLRGSTRIHLRAPALAPGSLADVVVTNPGPQTSTLAKGWFADFLDAPGTHSFHRFVEKMVRLGITAGCGGGNYCPDGEVTRAQMAVFLLKARHGAGYLPPPATGAVFSDVSAGSFAAAWIEQLAASGITSGCGGGKYCPNDSVTRGQMALFLLKTQYGSGFVPPSPTGVFADVPLSNPFVAWIEELYQQGTTSGCGGSNYCPSSAVSRGQMAVFLVKSFDQADAVRLLEQATWGPSRSLANHVRGVGPAKYLDDQFLAPMSSYPTLPLWPNATPPDCDAICRRDNYSMYPLQTRFFVNALYGEDQLRQRVAFALHKILVVSGLDLRQPSRMAPYLQILDRNAFGNYRQLLEEITLNPGMGRYLDMVTSTRTNPNENYAREILQLFSVGLNRLDPDGTPQLDEDAVPIPTYGQAEVTEFARVFTGWTYATQPEPGIINYIDPMVLNASRHDTGSKTLFNGVVLPAGQSGTEDLEEALDNIFQHANLGPFLAEQLIAQLVTSNPSPAYVERVAAVFDDNGAGVRGDLKATIRALLLDPEARSEPADPNAGHLKEPVLLIANILRGFDARSANGSTQSDGYLSPQSVPMGQDLFRPPSVFSYFSPDYVVPGTTTVLGPEFGILSTSTALKRANFVNTIVFNGISVSTNAPNGTSLDFSRLQSLAFNASQLVQELSRTMMHGAMSEQMHDSIVAAVEAVSATNSLLRARQAAYLVGTSSQYQVQR